MSNKSLEFVKLLKHENHLLEFKTMEEIVDEKFNLRVKIYLMGQQLFQLDPSKWSLFFLFPKLTYYKVTDDQIPIFALKGSGGIHYFMQSDNNLPL